MEEVKLPVFDAFVLDGTNLRKFLYRAALAKAMTMTTKVEWKEDNDSTFLNALYGLKWLVTLGQADKPGTMVMDTGKPEEVRKLAAEHTTRLWRQFVSLALQGPMAVIPWMKKVEDDRQSDIKYLQKTALETKLVNQQVDQMLKDIIFTLAEVKFHSELALSTLGMFSFGGAAGAYLRFGIGAGYPVFVNVVESWDRGLHAQMLLSTAGKSGGESLLGLCGEEAAVINKGLTAGLVDKPVEHLRRLKALRTGSGKIMSGRAFRHAVSQQNLKADLGKLGVNTLGVALQGLSLWFFYQGCQASAEDFWKTVEDLD